MDDKAVNLQNALNYPEKEERLAAFAGLVELEQRGVLAAPTRGADVNNHIHTTYSFSPYSPSKAVWLARSAGLATAGIMDHDSVGGLAEFEAAGQIAGIATTGGVELRADFGGTSLRGRRLNNPDQSTIAYIALHGIPTCRAAEAEKFLAPMRAFREQRNRRMTERINALYAPRGIAIDYDGDVLPLSRHSDGGSVTERHLLFALAGKIIEKAGKGPALVDYVKNTLGLPLSAKNEAWLSDAANPFARYDLLGVLKSDVTAFYIDADRECPPVAQALVLARRLGAISAYAYLGDVEDSATGDKRAQRFEDAYLDELFEVISALGFDAVTYMPSRNTPAQLARVRSLCERHGLLQISGEDINSPRQGFVCSAARALEFAGLADAAWALIGHERQSGKDVELGMFSEKTKKAMPSLFERVAHYKAIALEKG